MPGTSGPLQVHVNTDDLRKLYVDLKGVEGNLRVELRRGIKKAADPLAQRVKAAAGWSSRIPGAVKVKPSFSATGAGVTIIVDAKQAPEAAPLENKGRGGTFRHPVYGNRDVWVTQAARPFFYAAVSSSSAVDAVEQVIVQVMDAVAVKAGFK